MVAPHFLLLSALLMAVPTTGVRVILSSSLSPTTVESADEEVTAQQRDDSVGLEFDANNIQTLDNADPNRG